MHSQAIMLTPEDLQRLQVAAIDHFVDQMPQIAIFALEVAESTLVINSLPELVEELILRSDAILRRASLILGVRNLEIYALNGRQVYSTELKSEEIPSNKNMAAVIENNQTTLEPSLDTERADSIDESELIAWKAIASRTSETEDQLQIRVSNLKSPFFWMSEGLWGVSRETASLLVMRYYFDRGKQEADNMLAETLNQPNDPNQPSEPLPTKVSTLSPKSPQKVQFTPNKKSLASSIERFLNISIPDVAKQQTALEDIINDKPSGKRQVTVMLNSYPEGFEKPSRGDILLAARNLLKKRSLPSSQPPDASAEESTPATADTE